jgi:hypothetical protein
MQNAILDKVEELTSSSLFVFLAIVVMLFIPDTVFSYLSRMEGMPINFLISLAYVYCIFIWIAIPCLAIVHSKRTEIGLLKAFLVGFIPFVIFAVFQVMHSIISNISFSHRIYPDYYLSQFGYYTSLGLIVGLMSTSIQIYKKSDKLLGLLLFAISVGSWLLLIVFPLITFRID